MDKYALIKPNHTYWREFTFSKFLSGFAVGYLVLREVNINMKLDSIEEFLCESVHNVRVLVEAE